MDKTLKRVKLFATLHIGKALRYTGIQPSIVFSLVFEGISFVFWKMTGGADLPGKDVVYRFLNQPFFAWRRFFADVKPSDRTLF
jgi:hypothetical protein